jgi:tRNA G18 (ribose-2'-O)-methylase SpoU
VASLSDLESWGFTTVATVVSGGRDPALLDSGRYALLVGAEATGLPPDVIEAASVELTIPMPGGTQSLNAAVAAAILTYEITRHQVPGARDGQTGRAF